MRADIVKSPARATRGVELEELAAPGFGEVLIASHGGRSGGGAIRVGRTIARRWHLPVEILGVLTPVALYPPEVAIDLGQIEEAERDALRDQIATQVQAMPFPSNVPITLVTGGPADVISDVAQDRQVSLVVVGLGQRDLLDRLLGGQTPVQVLRRAAVPLLAVPPDASDPPRVVVIATDFSDSASSAARMALALAADDALVYLVHAPPERSEDDRRGVDSDVWNRVIDEGTNALLARFAEGLSAPGAGSLHTALLRGHPARAILAFAQSVGANLIAVGSHGRPFIERLRLGSVAEALLRTAQCAVLVVSAHAVARAVPGTGTPR
jgi:nucleotide-binding universal stress UspA family protein